MHTDFNLLLCAWQIKEITDGGSRGMFKGCVNKYMYYFASRRESGGGGGVPPPLRLSARGTPPPPHVKKKNEMKYKSSGITISTTQLVQRFVWFSSQSRLSEHSGRQMI